LHSLILEKHIDMRLCGRFSQPFVARPRGRHKTQWAAAIGGSDGGRHPLRSGGEARQAEESHDRPLHYHVPAIWSGGERTARRLGKGERTARPQRVSPSYRGVLLRGCVAYSMKRVKMPFLSILTRIYPHRQAARLPRRSRADSWGLGRQSKGSGLLCAASDVADARAPPAHETILRAGKQRLAWAGGIEADAKDLCLSPAMAD
jgi:hypothetical protein